LVVCGAGEVSTVSLFGNKQRVADLERNLDVSDEEARTLLLSIDPLASLAQMQDQLHRRLLELTPQVSEELRTAWEDAAQLAVKRRPAATLPKAVAPGPEQFLVLVGCRDERQQVELLERFTREGLECKALLA
jgi:hypothetical protein